jgi:site-specific recombinase XerD
MYQHGEVDVLILKDMLGHEQLSTTEIYTHLENKQLRDAAKKNPLSTVKSVN